MRLYVNPTYLSNSCPCFPQILSVSSFIIAVLPTIENEVQNRSIVEGESAIFTCEFSKEDVSDIDISWTVDGDQYDECGTTEELFEKRCYVTADHLSVLLIRDTSSFSTDSIPVQCILQPDFPNEFRNDPSFQKDFNITTSSAFLLVGEFTILWQYTLRVEKYMTKKGIDLELCVSDSVIIMALYKGLSN